MKKSVSIWVIATLVIMLLLPWLAATFVKSDAGMAVCLLLFYVVNPIYFIVLGIASGKNMKSMWWQPLLSSCMFLAGIWLFFTVEETAFFIYAGIYLALGGIAMLISSLIGQLRYNNKVKC